MWTKENMPEQTGKTVIITGANTGLGYQDSLALYEKGADVIMAVRDPNKTQPAIDAIKNTTKGKGSIRAISMDLSSLDSIKQFANIIMQQYEHLDILINNAGVMMCPPALTKSGFEMQFGVNFIGHFALTGYLYPLLKSTPNSRIVTLSSGAHRAVEHIDFDNLKLEKEYNPRREYSTSKLADLIFAIELQRRINLQGDHILSLAAHPGITRTDLQRHLDDVETQLAKYATIMQPWQGALSTLYAPPFTSVNGGAYYGPDRDSEQHGYPAPANISDAARNKETATKLWEYAQQATAIQYP